MSKSTEGIRRLPISLSLAKKRHEKDRKRILGEQLNGTQKKGEALEAHQEEGNLAGMLAVEQRAKTLEQTTDKGGCNGLRIIFSSEVESMKKMGHRDWKCLQTSVWKLRHWRAIIAWSTPAELLKILLLPYERAQTPHKHGIGYTTKRESSPYVSAPISQHFFMSFFAVVHAAEHAPISWLRPHGPFIPKGRDR